MAKKVSKISEPEVSFNINEYFNLPLESLQEAIRNVDNAEHFCQVLFESALNEPSVRFSKLIYQLLQMKIDFKFREEVLGYFGLPAFTKLSETKLKHEIESCQDSRLEEAVSNISSSINGEASSVLKAQAEFFKSFIDNVCCSSDLEYIETSLELIILLLLQPSCRRFIKPLLEDKLFPSFIKFKIQNSNLLTEFENVFYFPIDELSGVYYESQEEYISAHFSKIRNFQSKLLESNGPFSITSLPLNSFAYYQQIYNASSQLCDEQLTTILWTMGCAGFNKDTPRDILIDAISSNLVLRKTTLNESIAVFPTEANLQNETILRPLTCESLSRQELFQRHQKILQANLFSELADHLKENIIACKPVLNRNGKTEFSGWTRDAMEIVSSAIVKTSNPDVRKQGKYQHIELDVTVPLAPLDQLTLKSWMDLKSSEVVFVCRIDAQENGEYILKTLRSVVVESRSVSKNILTLKLLVDPEQFDMNTRTEVFSKLNFIVKRSSSESNDVRILKSLSSQIFKTLPEYLEDAIIGISHPDEIQNLSESFGSVRDSSLTKEQNEAVQNCLKSGLSLIEGPFGSGCTTVLKSTAKSLLNANSTSAIIFRSGPAVDKFYQDLVCEGVAEHQIVRFGFSSTLGHLQQKYNDLIKKCVENINLQVISGLDSNDIYTCGEADFIMKGTILPRWEAFNILLNNEKDEQVLKAAYPFAKCSNFDNNSGDFDSHFKNICNLFHVAKLLAPLELLQSNVNVSKYALGNLAKIVLMTSKYAAINAKELSETGLNFENLLVDDCNLIPEVEVLLALTSQANPSNSKRLCIFGHENGGRPQCFNEKLKAAGASNSLMDRIIYSGFSKTVHLPSNNVFSSPWQKWMNSTNIPDSSIFEKSLQFVSVPLVIGKGEEMPMRNYIQNLDEAEFAVALFQLLRLNDVPAKDIAILTAYKGQVDLIKEVLQTRCNWTDFYGEPAFIGTIDQSIGLQFKNVIVSLVRTKSVGFLSDTSRLELALTRSSDNLVILGFAEIFATNGGFFESLATQFGTGVKLRNGSLFSNVEDISSYVYDQSIKKLQ